MAPVVTVTGVSPMSPCCAGDIVRTVRGLITELVMYVWIFGMVVAHGVNSLGLGSHNNFIGVLKF